MGNNASKPQASLKTNPFLELKGHIVDLKIEQIRRKQQSRLATFDQFCDSQLVGEIAKYTNHGKSGLPSREVIDALKLGLIGIGPLSNDDGHVLTRILHRLSEIEAKEGQIKAISAAELVAQVFDDLAGK
jgi:hypothetical protein